MNRIRTTAVLGALSLALAGCFSSGPKQDAGTLVGAVTGGLIGGAASGNASGAIVGALAGGLIGNAIGADLDAADRHVALDAEYRALEYGRAGTPVQWRGRSGRYGDVVAGAQYRVNDFSCRDYTHTIYIDGRQQVARGTACRQPDGTWKAVG
ncbi:MAG: glycine zipper domain-containing protein [Bauldia sp.]|nr:glycine zipper domain-containing protein [Bauldia sp.]